MNGSTIDDLDKILDQQEEQLIWDRLDGFMNPALLGSASIISWGSSDKAIILSDLHQGDGGPADDYLKNDALVRNIIQHYRENGYKIILNGDVEDGWKFDFDTIEKKYGVWLVDYRIQGNHDRALGEFPEAILLKGNGNSILIDHGYAGEVTTDLGWKTSRWVVRHIWMPLETTGILQDPTTHPCPSVNPDRHALVVQARHNWAFQRAQVICYGHTHSPDEDRPYVFNSGCCIKSDGVTALVVEGFEIHVEHFT